MVKTSVYIEVMQSKHITSILENDIFTLAQHFLWRISPNAMSVRLATVLFQTGTYVTKEMWKKKTEIRGAVQRDLLKELDFLTI